MTPVAKSLGVEIVYRRVDTSQPTLNGAAITSWQLYAAVFAFTAVFRYRLYREALFA